MKNKLKFLLLYPVHLAYPAILIKRLLPNKHDKEAGIAGLLNTHLRFDLDVNPSWKCQGFQGINCFTGGIQYIDKTTVCADLKLLA